MARFTLPRDLYHGKGALEALKSFTGKKAMICVGGGSMKRFGFLDRAVEYLKEAGMEVELFEGIEPDPSVETVMRGAEAMLKFEPDWIIAMGGGSPIDAAKAMWIKYEYPEITFEEMCNPVFLLIVSFAHFDINNRRSSSTILQWKIRFIKTHLLYSVVIEHRKERQCMIRVINHCLIQQYQVTPLITPSNRYIIGTFIATNDSRKIL